jgi:Glycosyl transferase family 2
MTHKYELAVGALFKNESDSIYEWINHYIHHGVQHFYLINDNSTDNSIDVIQPYIESGMISLFNADCPYYLGRQRAMYNQYILPNIKETKWLIIVDMDEYLWSQQSLDLKDVFNICGHLAQIQFNHTLFGSNGHISQPNGIVRNFTKRSMDRPSSIAQNYKYAINTNFDFTSLNIHHANSTNPEFMEKEYFLILGEPYFIMNHYSCQSLDFWNKVKCTRGDGDHYLVRTMDHFNLYNINEIEDLELLEQNKALSVKENLS